jgi:hypothetical protein
MVLAERSTAIEVRHAFTANEIVAELDYLKAAVKA